MKKGRIWRSSKGRHEKPRESNLGKLLFRFASLCMMAVLVGGSVWAAATEEKSSGSYTLVIQKLFEESGESTIPEQAKDLTYTFNVVGMRYPNSDQERAEYGDVRELVVPVNQTIDLNAANDSDHDPENGWQSEVIDFGVPFDVTVTEITDNVQITEGGTDYNMGDSSCDAELETSGKHILNLRNNSRIKLKLPDDAPRTTWFRVTRTLYNEHESYTTERVFTLDPGESKPIVFDLESGLLRAGAYTIEPIEAPDTFSVQVGERTETVASEKGTGTFFINGEPGKLTLTAGGTNGDGKEHYFDLTSDNAQFTSRRVSIQSGESYELDNLPRGKYTVTEHTYEAENTKYTVTKPRTAARSNVSAYSSALYTPENNPGDSSGFRGFSLPADTAYVDLLTVGPLQADGGRKNGKQVYEPVKDADSITYTKFQGGAKGENGKLTTRGVSTSFLGNYTYTLSSTVNGEKVKYIRIQTPFAEKNSNGEDVKYLYFATRGLSKETNSNGQTVKWNKIQYTPYYHYTKDHDCENPNKKYALTIDDRAWLTIKSPEKGTGPGAGNVEYVYKIYDEDENLIREVTMAPEDEKTVENLGGAGTYYIEEVIKENAVGFTMKISGKAINMSGAGNGFSGTDEDHPNIFVYGPRRLTISKPAVENPPVGFKPEDRPYTFSVSGNYYYYDDDGNKRWGNLNETVTVNPGESNKDITLPGEGTFSVTPVEDMPPTYYMTYSDSGAVYGTAKGETTVTFTNRFTVGQYGYRYIHEYYYKNPDGTYDFEGCSPIMTVRGRSNVDEQYSSLDIRQAPNYTTPEGQTYAYTYFSDGYGNVLSPGAKAAPALEEYDSGAQTEDNNALLMSPSDGTDVFDEADAVEESAGADEDDESEIVGTPEEPNETGEPDGLDEPDLQDGPEEFVLTNASEELNGIGEPDASERALSAEDEVLSPSEALGASEVAATVEALAESEQLGGSNESHEPDELDKAGEPEEFDGSDESGMLNAFAALDETVVDSDIQDEADPDGILSSGSGVDTQGNPMKYQVEPEKRHIGVTEEAEEIIVLRYYRNEDVARKCKYNVIHAYFMRDETGDHWEGVSAPIVVDNASFGVPYSTLTADPEAVKLVTKFQPADADEPYEYIHDNRPQYGRLLEGDIGKDSVTGEILDGYVSDNQHYEAYANWSAVMATETGDQIIILRYYREKKVVPGHYHVVHEYYLRESRNASDDVIDSPDIDEGETGEEIETQSLSEREYDNIEPGSGKSQRMDAGSGGRNVIEADDIDPDFMGTLNLSDEYEYTFEGISEIDEITAPLESDHYANDVTRKPEFEEHSYTYLNEGYGIFPETPEDEGWIYLCNPDRKWAEATETGNEIIILRYYRESGDPGPDPDPDPDPKPDPDPDPKPDPNPDPTPDPDPDPDPPRKPNPPGGNTDDPDDPPDDPENPETPPETPENPETPPETPETPPEAPVTPEAPFTPPTEPGNPVEPVDPEIPRLQELPDPNDPNSPDEVTIWENGVPLTYIKVWDPDREEYVYILADEPPLASASSEPTARTFADNPLTGDPNRMALWSILGANALFCLFYLNAFRRRRRRRASRR